MTSQTNACDVIENRMKVGEWVEMNKYGILPSLAILWIVMVCERKPREKKKEKVNHSIEYACCWSNDESAYKYKSRSSKFINSS